MDTNASISCKFAHYMSGSVTHHCKSFSSAQQTFRAFSSIMGFDRCKLTLGLPCLSAYQGVLLPVPPLGVRCRTIHSEVACWHPIFLPGPGTWQSKSLLQLLLLLICREEHSFPFGAPTKKSGLESDSCLREEHYMKCRTSSFNNQKCWQASIKLAFSEKKKKKISRIQMA